MVDDVVEGFEDAVRQARQFHAVDTRATARSAPTMWCPQLKLQRTKDGVRLVATDVNAQAVRAVATLAAMAEMPRPCQKRPAPPSW